MEQNLTAMEYKINEIAGRIRELRDISGFTVEEMARRTDLSVEEYIQCVRMIQSRLPDATIVVSSILPARDPAFNRSEKWRNIPQWSAALEKACKDNGILFANCDYLAVSYPNLWDPDGIHFRKEFYPYWASNLVVTTLMEGVG